MSVLDVVDPAGCDEHGVPLDWERCRTCLPDRPGYVEYVPETRPGAPTFDVMLLKPCPTCGGHGSLKAAALAELLRPLRVIKPGRSTVMASSPDPAATGSKPGELLEWTVRTFYFGEDEISGGDPRDRVVLMHGVYEWSVHPADLPSQEARCEGCGHPMSDGTWEANHLRRGWEPWPGDMLAEFDPSRRRELMWRIDAAYLHEPHEFPSPIHWSLCDAGCRHGGPLRVDDGRVVVEDAQYARGSWPDNPVEASWRAVDVRTLGWPHDLRPEKLAVLCLRCWAERSVGR